MGRSGLPAIALAAAAVAACGGGSGGEPGRGAPSGAAAAGRADSERIVRGDRRPPPFPVDEFPGTDFSVHKGSLDEFSYGGVPRDGIPPIDRPRFGNRRDGDRMLGAREPVLTVEIRGEARAYPLRIMLWHEIVNDAVGGRPIAVTYCPLCNSGVVLDRRLGGRTLDFGNTGVIRRSDLVMYDRQTGSWWQQLTGEAVVGRLTGARLRALPSQTLSWRDFARLHPDGEVLLPPRGGRRPYGRSPYVGYDDPRNELTGLRGERTDPALPAKERVASLQLAGRAVVYPFTRLARDAPVNDEVAGRPLVVFFAREVGSVLDTERVRESRDTGASAIFDRRLGGRTLDFERARGDGRFRDRQTGSTWDMTGRAVGGPLRGKRLRAVPHDDHFWFAIAAFYEDPDIRQTR